MSSEPPRVPRRRRAFLEEGRSIYLSMIPHHHAINYAEFQAASGLRDDELISSVMCPVPIPRYPIRRPRPSAEPAMLWHPFLWLPPHIAAPRDEDEALDQDLLALRIAIEADVIGLWDQPTGTWLDVCQVAGVDLDNPDGLAAARDWLAGKDVRELDEIDLSEWGYSETDPLWATKAAKEMFLAVMPVVWSEGAATQLVAIEVISQERQDGMLPEGTTEYLAAIAGISVDFFSRTPAREGKAPPSEEFRRMEMRFRDDSTTEQETWDELVPALTDEFKAIEEEYRPFVEQILKEDGAVPAH